MHLRVARPSDAAAMLEIYAPFIENTSITFETATPTEEEFADRISHYLEDYPWLVCEIDGKLAGYAYASRYRERKAYQWSVECSVYVKDEYLRKSVASSLYTALFSILQKQGFRNVYAVINLPNDRSVAMHEKMGFIYFATYEQVGYKLGKWKNVGWWRKVINEFSDPPEDPLPFRSIYPDKLQGLFQGNP